ncbi:GFA family protein [Nitratireductor pacificus]|uniref:Glutathione-dependent formaldehyde-activating GFA n=1 Tax=Nitratireductor pacificus pht-3B TaxID=391937 RepID=K2LJK2_9HYPH|nr:GFA family protein [Nitratireductor pacificus]EKF17934.1 glutathione-dependent formaldehyde-activating GFA [Nitratireductor pacificus pht-3B]
MSSHNDGSCLCGAVRFRTSGPLRGVVYCHCSQCRKQTGLYYAATDVRDDDLTIEGAESLTWYAASDFARRGFCKVCGSALFWKRNGADQVSIMAGAFEQPTGLAADSHIFVADKGDFYTIDDGLPQHARSSAGVIVAGDDD